MSFKYLLRVLCCPPCPATIVSRLAFWPPEPTYRLITSSLFQETTKIHAQLIRMNRSCTGRLEEIADEYIDVFRTPTYRGNSIVCMHIRCNNAQQYIMPLMKSVDSAKSAGDDIVQPVNRENTYTILYSHENAVDLGDILSDIRQLSRQLDCNILAYDYSGYGCSSGEPSERNLYADAEAAWHALQQRYGLKENQVIVYGSSIGSAAAVHLATRYKFACVVLQSALMSGLRVLCGASGVGCGGSGRAGCGVGVGGRNRGCGGARPYRWPLDAFVNISKIAHVSSPVLVIHGTEDDVVSMDHGRQIHERCRWPLPPLWIEGAGHNDIQQYAEFLERMNRLIRQELPKIAGYL